MPETLPASDHRKAPGPQAESGGVLFNDAMGSVYFVFTIFLKASLNSR